MLLTGLRGVGKTVLLNEMAKRAVLRSYRAISVEASESKPLGALLIPHLQSLLFELDRSTGFKEKSRRALAVFRSFKLTYNPSSQEVGMSLDIAPETGSADSGDLEADLSTLFVAVAEVAEDKKLPSLCLSMKSSTSM